MSPEIQGAWDIQVDAKTTEKDNLHNFDKRYYSFLFFPFKIGEEEDKMVKQFQKLYIAQKTSLISR